MAKNNKVEKGSKKLKKGELTALFGCGMSPPWQRKEELTPRKKRQKER